MQCKEKDTKIFKAFSDSKRLEILELLKYGEQCACVLLEQLELSQSGLSYHMKILIDSGIILSRQEGKWIYYKISKNGRENIINLFLKYTQDISDKFSNE